jgi:hypothetical protein
MPREPLRQRDRVDFEFAAASDVLHIVDGANCRGTWRSGRRVLLAVLARRWPELWRIAAKMVADDPGGI